MESVSKDFRNFQTKTMLTDGETTLDNCPFDKDRKVVDNILKSEGLRDLSCDVYSNDDPKGQKVEEAELPKRLATSADYCKSSTSCLSRAYQRSAIFRSNLFHATSEYFDFSSHAHDDSIDFGFFDDDQD